MPENFLKTDESQITNGWLSILIGIILCLLMVKLWTALENRENINRHQAVRAEAQKILDIIHFDINNRIQSLQRIVKRWEVRGGTPKEEFISDVQNYINDYPGYQAIEWVDKNFYVQWIVPLAGNESAKGMNLMFEKNRRTAFEKSRDQKKTVMSSIVDLVQGGKGFLIYFPIYVQNEFEGFIIAVFRTQTWLAHLVRTEETQEDIKNFINIVFINDIQVFHEAKWKQQNELWDTRVSATIFGHDFLIQTRPTKYFIDQSHSLLPELVFVTGVLLSILISIIVYLFQKASKAVKIVRAGKTALENEISVRKQIEIERETLLHDLGERIKELNCLYGLSKLAQNSDTKLEDIFYGMVELIPSSWQYPEYTCARIIFKDHKFESINFQETQWKQEASILINKEKKGVVQVCYTKKFYNAFEGPFLKEERLLINEIANRLGRIIQQKQAAELLAKERQRLSYILEGTNVGTWEWNIQTGETIVNERWAGIIGYTLEELAPVSIDTWIKFVHPEDINLSESLLKKHFNKELDYYECQVRMRHKNGSWVWVLDRGKVATWTDKGEPLLMCGTHMDITQQKLYEAKIRHLANHDALTNLPSLRLAKDRILMAIETANRKKKMAAVLFVDLDGFKSVNDSYGHDAGDIVLKEVARRLLFCVRKMDTVARIGGDEFLIVVTELQIFGNVEKIAKKVIKLVSQPVFFNENQASVGASIGIAFYPDDGTDADSLIKQADKAMYLIKNSGKNGYSFANPRY